MMMIIFNICKVFTRLAGGERGEAAGGEGEVRHLVVTGVAAEWLKSRDTGNYFYAD